MDTALLIADLKQAYGWELTPVPPQPPDATGQGPRPPDAMGEGPRPEDALEAQLAEKINEMIQRDFEGLVQLLYRVDVSEQKLRLLLNGAEDAGKLIARLIIERQWQKIESRRRYRQDGGAGTEDEERW